MKYLGVDYGRKKIGLAISDGKLAEPYKVIRYIDIKTLSKQLKQIIRQENIEKVVIGISEGKMAKESKKFGQAVKLCDNEVVIDFFDETLSTYDAQQMSIQSHMGRKKRKEMEDAFSASIMLQSYIDYV